MLDRDWNLRVAKACDMRVAPFNDIFRGIESLPCIGVNEDYELALFTKLHYWVKWNPIED